MFFKKPFVDKEKFTSFHVTADPLYGLSEDIKYCKNCLMSNQRPNMCPEHYHTKENAKSIIKFTDGICDACLLKNKKDNEIDWEERERELKALLDKYRSKNGSYDVLIPGSGGKDSFYVAHILKYKYGMNPLTCTFAPNIYTDWGLKNFYSWLEAGFNNYKFTVDIKVHRLITRISLENLLHPFQPWILGQKNFPTKFAKLTKIPLIFYGENPAEYGNPNDKYYDDMLMEWHACNNLDNVYVAGLPISELSKRFKLVNSNLEPYLPLTYEEFKDNNLKCVAFSYFKKWHPQENYYYTVENSNFITSPERTAGTYSKYSSIDDKIDDLHYYTAKIKFGIGRTHYDVAQEIRSGDLTTSEGKSLINKFDGEYPKRFEKEIFDYLSLDNEQYKDIQTEFEVLKMNRDYFDNLCDSFRSPHLWRFSNEGWSLRKTIDS